MDDRDRNDWDAVIDAALDSPDAVSICVPRELLLAVDEEYILRRDDASSRSVMWFVVGGLAGIAFTSFYVSMVVFG